MFLGTTNMFTKCMQMWNFKEEKPRASITNINHQTILYSGTESNN